jgi:hypothetical protein
MVDLSGNGLSRTWKKHQMLLMRMFLNNLTIFRGGGQLRLVKYLWLVVATCPIADMPHVTNKWLVGWLTCFRLSNFNIVSVIEHHMFVHPCIVNI